MRFFSKVTYEAQNFILRTSISFNSIKKNFFDMSAGKRVTTL